MDTPNKNMYHFVWNDDDDEQPYGEQQSLSPKERVAKILRETELGDIPDLMFRGDSGKKDSKKARSHNTTEHPALKTDTELFSIDDSDSADEFVFEGTLDIADNNNVVETRNNNDRGDVQSQYKERKPAKVPPNVSTSHPTRPLQRPQNKEAGRQVDTYIDESTAHHMQGNNKAGSRLKDSANTSALLPMDQRFLEMEFDDDVDSGVAVDVDHDPNQDTVPIVTVDQMELNERWKKRRQKINMVVAFLLVVLGVVVLVVAIVLIVRMLRAG